MYYNADLLDMTKKSIEELGLGFIDDIVYGVTGYSDKRNVRKLKEILRKAEEWRKKHRAQFERSKYVLVHYTRNSNLSTKATVTIDNVTISPSEEARYLGVIFDKQL